MIKNIFRAFLPPIVVFWIHAFLIFGFNAYAHVPMLDVPMHFFGGASIAMTASLLYRLGLKYHSVPSMRVVLRLFLITCIVTWVAVLWEFAEFFSDATLHTFMQAGIRDTMGDLLLGMMGGLTGAALMNKR